MNRELKNIQSKNATVFKNASFIFMKSALFLPYRKKQCFLQYIHICIMYDFNEKKIFHCANTMTAYWQES